MLRSCSTTSTTTSWSCLALWVSMTIEYSGLLLHSSYLLSIQMLVAKLAGKTIESNEEPRNNASQNLFFWFRCLLMSLAILLRFCFAATLAGLSFRARLVPSCGTVFQMPFLSSSRFFVIMSVIGLLEGMQTAFSLLSPRFPSLNEEETRSSPRRPASSYSAVRVTTFRAL
jgi:hypothetical protein